MFRIGLVYDSKDEYRSLGFDEESIAEYDSEETIQALDDGLSHLGAYVTRIGRGLNLARRLAGGENWDLIWNISEGEQGRSREAQVPALCEMYGQPYVFSDPLTMSVTLDKSMAKRVVRDAGIPTAAFTVLETTAQTAKLDIPFPVFLKPIAEGTSKGCALSSVCYDLTAAKKTTKELIAKFNQPVLAETYLSGREFTVGIVGNGKKARVIGTAEILIRKDIKDRVYSYSNKMNYRDRVSYVIPKDRIVQKIEQYALGVYQVLDCRDSARVDFLCDEKGTPHFLEVNPIAGLNPEDSDLPILARLKGHTYQWLLEQILFSACERLGVRFPMKAAV